MDMLQSLDMIYKLAIIGVGVWLFLRLLGGVLIGAISLIGSYIITLYASIAILIICVLCYISWAAALIKIVLILF